MCLNDSIVPNFEVKKPLFFLFYTWHKYFCGALNHKLIRILQFTEKKHYFYFLTICFYSVQFIIKGDCSSILRIEAFKKNNNILCCSRTVKTKWCFLII